MVCLCLGAEERVPHTTAVELQILSVDEDGERAKLHELYGHVGFVLWHGDVSVDMEPWHKGSRVEFRMAAFRLITIIKVKRKE